MNRTCDGTDPNLTRRIPRHQYNPATMTLSPWDSIGHHDPAQAVIQCQCGLTFDDAARRVTWPHHHIRPRDN